MKSNQKLIKVRIITLGLTLAFVAFSVVLQSCEKEGNETNISHNGSNKSHNMGQNCMQCHRSGGSGEGWFNIAGTVYDSLQHNTKPNGLVKLYTGPDGTGTVKYTIEVDAKGNFHTTDAIDFGSGLYPSVVNSTGGGQKFMSASITNGACNSCHNNTEDKIWVN